MGIALLKVALADLHGEMLGRHHTCTLCQEDVYADGGSGCARSVPTNDVRRRVAVSGRRAAAQTGDCVSMTVVTCLGRAAHIGKHACVVLNRVVDDGAADGGAPPHGGARMSTTVVSFSLSCAASDV